MKTFVKSKYFIGGMIVGLSLLSAATYASVAGAGTLGQLFYDKNSIGVFDENSQYRLHGDAIADNTVDSSEIENESIKSEDIKDGEIKSEDINSSYGLWNKSGNNLYYNGGKVGIGINSPAAQLEVKNGNDAFKMGNIEIHHTNEINNQIGNLYLQYRGGKNTILNKGGGNVGIGTSSPYSKLDITGDLGVRGNILRMGSASRDDDGHGSDKVIQWGRSSSRSDYIDIYIPGNSDRAETSKMSLLQNGNVGIGTNFPNVKLDVNGDINARDDVYLRDDLRFRRNKAWFILDGDTKAILYENGNLWLKGKLIGSQAKFKSVTTGRWVGSNIDCSHSSDSSVVSCGSDYKVLYATYGEFNINGSGDGFEKGKFNISRGTSDVTFTVSTSDNCSSRDSRPSAYGRVLCELK